MNRVSHAKPAPLTPCIKLQRRPLGARLCWCSATSSTARKTPMRCCPRFSTSVTTSTKWWCSTSWTQPRRWLSIFLTGPLVLWTWRPGRSLSCTLRKCVRITRRPWPNFENSVGQMWGIRHRLGGCRCGSGSFAGAFGIPHQEGQTFLNQIRTNRCAETKEHSIFAPHPNAGGNRKGFGLEEEVW